MSAELKAGYFVLLSLAALAFMTTQLTKTRYSSKGTKSYQAHVKDATGLLPKTKIKMAGLDVGQIDAIELVASQAKVKMSISAEVLVHKDARVIVKTIGFLGDKYVELFPGSDGAALLEEGGMITEDTAGGGIEELTKKTSEVIDNIKEITQILKEAIKGDSEEEDSRLDRILDNMENFTAGLSSIEKYGELADRLNEVAMNIRDITEKVKKGEGSIGKLLSDSETIDKINSTLSGINKFITKADKTALIIDYHGGALTNVGGSKSYFSLTLQPTYDKFYLLGVNTGPRFKRAVTRTSTTTSPDTSSASTATRQDTVEYENAIFINAQFGKRFGDTIARIGLFETTGGLAVDQLLFEEKMKIYTEFYRFGVPNNDTFAQLNVGIEFHFFKPLYFWGGGDDVLSSRFRNAFIGGGLRFTDNDIKAIVGAASAAGSMK